MSYHTILIVGRLGREPEMRYTPSGQPVTNFNLAANRQYADANGEVVKETIWFKVSAWGKTAETCSQYLYKGSLVLVEGRMLCDPETCGPRLYNRKDGSSATSYEVIASTVRFLSGSEGESFSDTNDSSNAPLYGEIQF